MTTEIKIFKQLRNISLNNWLLIAMILGFLIGLILNIFVPESYLRDTILIDNIFYFFGTGFIDLMKMLVVPLVFCSIVVGTSAINNASKVGKISIEVIILYLVTTFIAICLAIGIGAIIQPGTGLKVASSTYTTNLTSNTTFTDSILNMIPSNFVGSLANGDMIPIIIFAILVGVILSMLGNETEVVSNFFTQFNKVMIKMTYIVLKVAPIGIFCLMASTFATLGIEALIPLGKFILCVIIAIAIQLFIIYPIILALFTRLNPITFFKKFSPAMLFAFSSTSSNATIPLTLEGLTNLGVSEEISSFSIPLGATINMDGNAIMQGCAIMFAAQAYGLDLATSVLLTVLFTAVVASISAAGIPSAAIISMNMLFMSVGLPLDIIAILMGIDHFIDMFRTAINVTGDGLCTVIVAFKNKALNIDKYNKKVLNKSV